MTTADDLLDGFVGQRVEGFTIVVTDANNNALGTLVLDRDSVPTIENDVNQTIRRTISNLRVPPRPLGDQSELNVYADELDTLTQRLRPYWLLGTGDEYPLGVFEFGDDSGTLYSWGTPREVSGVDLMIELDQPVDESVAYSAGSNVSDALEEQAALAGFGASETNIEASAIEVAEPTAWAVGRDSRLRVLEGLCAIAGFLPPYFDNDGMLTCRSAPDLSEAVAAFAYGFGLGAVIEGSIVASNDILTAPNRYIVIDGSATDFPIVGIFDVPDSAPHSYALTGRRRVSAQTVQGLTDEAGADAAAAAAYAADTSTYAWLAFDTPVDPRHDTYDIISFEGQNYRQMHWSIECRAGGLMQHDCRGAYSAINVGEL